jgi:hypothetical protein
MKVLSVKFVSFPVLFLIKLTCSNKSKEYKSRLILSLLKIEITCDPKITGKEPELGHPTLSVFHTNAINIMH